MKKQTERDLARYMLVQRRNGYSITHVLRKSAIRYAIQLGILVGLIVWFQRTEVLSSKGLCLWGIGVYTGVLLRDVGWLRRIKQQWPFTEKIVDWRTVEDLAEEPRSHGSVTDLPDNTR